MTIDSIDNLNWTDFIKDPAAFQIAADLRYQLHVATTTVDYSYINSISIDADFYLKLKKTGELKAINYNIGQFSRAYTPEYIKAYPDEGTMLTVAEPNHESPEIIELKNYLKLDIIYCRKLIQSPGKMHPQHTDLNRELSCIIAANDLNDKVKVKNIRKYIVYLEDWAHGQVFMLGRQACTNWQKGDIISFPWFMPHSTANAGLVDRPLMFISGVEF